MQLGRLASSKYSWWTGSLESQEEPMLQFQTIRLKKQEELMFHSSLKAISWRIPLSEVGKDQTFVFVRPSTDGTSPIHIMEDNLLYPKSTNLNINLIQNHPHRDVQDNA